MKAISTLLLLVLASSVMGQIYPMQSDTIQPGTYVVTDNPSAPCVFVYNGECYTKPDTVKATIDYQYTRRDIPMTIDCYLINGIPYRKSCAPLTKGKWVRVQCVRWRISNGWVNSK
jgi:hypothetical protein